MEELEKIEIELLVSRCETNIKEMQVKILKNLKANEEFQKSINKQTELLDQHKSRLKE